MASMIDAPESGESLDILHSSRSSLESDNTNMTDSATSAGMAEREAKKQRLRELRNAHDCVKKIVNHMGKHYKTLKPPPWLDLRVVASQLDRSTRTGCKHAAWSGLRDALANIRDWMGSHPTWKEAAEVSKMPYISTPSEIMAMAFIDDKGATIPRTLLNTLVAVKLDFLLDWEPRTNDRLPNFWKDSEFDNPQWRRINMKKRSYEKGLPFSDDLTDLVLSVVCKSTNSRPENKQRTPEAEESQVSPDDTASTKTIKVEPGTTQSSDGVWGDDAQATMPRIPETVNETVAMEKSRHLKRHRREDGTIDDRTKRHKTSGAALSPNVINSIEESDDDHSSASSPARKTTTTHDRYRALKARYKKLMKQDQQRVALLDKLEERNNSLRLEIERMAAQHDNMRKDNATTEEKHQQLAEEYGRLKDQIESLEKYNWKWADHWAALADDIKKLKEQGGHRDALGGAFKDNNKGPGAETAAMVTAVEALEQRPAIELQGESSGTTALGIADKTNAAAGHPQLSTQMGQAKGAPQGGAECFRPLDDGRNAPTSVLPSLEHQSDLAFKDENAANLPYTELRLEAIPPFLPTDEQPPQPRHDEIPRSSPPQERPPPPPPPPRHDEVPQFLLPLQAQLPQPRDDEIPQFLPPQARPQRPRRSLSEFPRVLEMPTFDPPPHGYLRHGIFNEDPVPGYAYSQRLTTYPNAAVRPHSQMSPTTRAPPSPSLAPAQAPIPTFFNPLPALRPPPPSGTVRQPPPPQLPMPTPMPTQGGGWCS